ncbi:MAG TPA: sugar ABC transporter ATP-binding protein [Firmicutes bacterium]|nr:sugar ABC transporter ATP-binding protein [Bacillota bacterium]HBM69971.1 sugar ABC transporter ATP-binding protein [Bacillota bacterium]HBX25249.1 sugar ABC transporter ATP-binding protein [Bacillota bacterium]
MKNLNSIKKYLKGNLGLAFLSLLFATLSVISKLSIPFITGLVIDQMKNGNFEIMNYLFVAFAFLLLGSIFRYFFDIMVSILGHNVVKKMRDDVFTKFNKVPVSYLDTHTHGDLLLRLIGDIENVQTGLINGAGALYEGVVQILVTLVFMFYLNYALALTVVFLTPISLLVSKFISSRNAKYFRDQNAKLGELSSFGLETISNLETVQAYQLESSREEEFDKKNNEVKSKNFKAAFAASWINPATRVVNNSIYAILILFGSFILIKDLPLGVPFSVGALSSFLTYSLQYMTPFNEISDASSDILYALASLKRVNEVLFEKEDIDEGKEIIGDKVKTLQAKHINFSYDGKRQIISDFNLDIYAGHKIAFVGPTGCGKTTIINLLMRFYDPQNGGFYINGKPSTRYSKHDLRSHIGMVLQDTWLSHGTIRDNIAFGKKDATLEEVVEAAKKAHADEFIRRLPNGYDTYISNSSNLSSGEKQLLCVARIMLLEPEIVLLDEATSNIDLRTELALSSSFDSLMKGKTSLVVAHRLSTIQNADLIVVLKDGIMIENGNFDELMNKKGFFYNLYLSQLS